ncbi:glycoside hydrolase family 3 N-terminal domain-containing protein [Paractinoplanes ferrugineus]|uniref:Beta-N-acetylhexosaminidase n=1 Tax=Paractinoplanes ferrugineus TaxID=113564 RepID=A0A919IYE0_9ACTN|nr:glycoside hydrolase family 3 protein [Actinoplanes ferrugineus]GIE08979.1 beta-N-acetylhexosaminidase [Actinoplanes ferrugineus]
MVIDEGLRRLALGTLLGAFPGPTAPPWARSLLGSGLAGFTLFGGNVDGSPSALTASLRAVRDDVIVAIDEEGGDVTRLDHRTGSPYPGNAALGAIDDPELTRSIYSSIGASLVAAGITLDLAPVVDVNTAGDNPVIGTRSFGASTDLVSRHAAAAVTGLQEAGVSACAKHFPGHGATIADSHLALPTVDASIDVLRARDLPPFAAASRAGVRAVMTAHIRVPALTGRDPATFSREALSLLRREQAFAGVIVTDALEMSGAVLAAGGVPQGAVRALAAGADLLCLGSRGSAELIEAVAAEIGAATRDGRLALGRLEEAVSRTAELTSPGAPTGRALSPDDRSGLVAARRAVRVQGVLAGLESPLVVQLAPVHSAAVGRVPWGLGPLVGDSHLEVTGGAGSAEEILARAAGRPIVLVGRRVHRLPEDRALIEALAAATTLAVVEMGWPSSWRPIGVQAFITTYGGSRASSIAAAEVLGLA